MVGKTGILAVLATAAVLQQAPAMAADKPVQPVAVPAWDKFIDELRPVVPAALAKLPPDMRDDPQIQQEVVRLVEEALAERLLGTIAEDGDHPVFLPFLNATLNINQPNADTNYRVAEITPGGIYRLRGTRGSLRIAKIGQFNGHPSKVGAQGVKVSTYHDLAQLHVDAQDRFDVILSTTRPAGYAGDWWELRPTTGALVLRMVAADWAKERDPSISIERADGPITRPRPSAEQLEARLEQIAPKAALVAMGFVDKVARLRAADPVNTLKVWNLGDAGGLAGQFYYEGVYQLADDEALILETDVPASCGYYSLILTNPIYETIDWYNNHSSLNDTQLRRDKDGRLRVVISRNDPGVANWLDTAGYPLGMIQGRWTDCSSQPIPTLKKVMLADVPAMLPADTPRMTKEQREAVIRERRMHLQQRPLW